MDCHGAGGDWSFNSLIPEALDARCEFVVQTRWTEYTAMLEQGCDVALFVGQHARAGAERGVLSHTVSSTELAQPALQRRRSSARSASTPRCAGPGARRSRSSPATTSSAPSRASCSGPACTRSRSRQGLGRFAARHLAPARARELLEAAARDALRDAAERPGLRPRGAVHDRGRARHARPRRRLSATARTSRSPTRAPSRARRDTWWDAWRAIYL